MSNINFECDNGCAVDVGIPDRIFVKHEYLIVPCPTCGTKYIINDTGYHTLFKHRMMQFPALHF